MPFSLILFFLSIGAIFVSDIFANHNTSQLSFFLVLLSPFFLFLLIKIEKKKIHIPIKETILYLLFFICSIISTLLAIDKEIAFESLLIYGAGYLFFVFSFNCQDEIKKKIKFLLISISIFSAIIFTLNYFLKFNLFQESDSLFYSYDHNQIGNLLVLGLIPVFPSLLSFIFFVFITLSYSRTAYLASILTIILWTSKNKLSKKTIFMGGLIILISLIFLILTTKNIFFTKEKTFIGQRNIYFSYALTSIREKPWFGVGPNNFFYAASKYQINYGEETTTSHNLILDVFAENGVLAGIFFSSFLVNIIYRKKYDKDWLAFFALTFMFMIDFSYRFNIFLILWFIFAGLILDSNKKVKVNMAIPSLIIFVCAQVILFGQILLNQNLWKQSLSIYPLQKKAYEIAIEEKINQKNKQQAYYFLSKYDRIFGKSYKIKLKETEYYQILDQKNKAGTLYQQVTELRPLINIKMLKRIRDFYIGVYGSTKADKKMTKILRQIINDHLKQDRTSDLYQQINSFCLKTNLDCLK